MMCFTSARFWCVLCVLMCVCVCVCVWCRTIKPAQYQKQLYLCSHWRWVDILLLCVCVCACVRVRSRVCAHVVFVRSYNYVAFFLLFLPCYNLLLVWAQFLRSPVIVFFFFRRWCVIFLLLVCDYVWDRLVACECARAQFCERLNYVLFFLFLPLLMCYISIVCAYVWDRVPVRASLFLWAPATVFFFKFGEVRHRSCDIFCCGCTRNFCERLQFCSFFSPLLICYVFFCECVIACESAWLHALTHAP